MVIEGDYTVDIKNKIIDYSKETGIDSIGFCLAEPFYEIEDILSKREKSGFMCELESREYEKKIYPSLTMKDAKSFIVILESYNDISMKVNNGDIRGNISMAAVSTDYHITVMDKLKKLEEFLQSQVECKTKCYVDISPFSDRAIAKRAGLGFIGKNSMLITQNYGSKVFIGYILTDYYIEPDENTLKIDCYNCDKCVKACPTGAINNNGQIDCNRCISYLTQHRGNISDELKRKMGQQVYGCDVCQRVCPYNRVDNKESINIINPYPAYDSILGISNKEFKKTYSLTASGWRGKKLLQRNAIIGLGNSKSKRALKILEKYIYDIRDDIRKEIVIAIKTLSYIEGIELLNKMRHKESNEEIFILIDKAIEEIINSNS
jgi:epoxyqueuosine reductase